MIERRLDLARLTVRLTMPRGWTDKEADAALEALDAQGIPDMLRDVIRQRIGERVELDGVRVVVED
jgi:hypothetical protein